MLAGRWHPRSKSEVCLVIAASSESLGDILSTPGWFTGFRSVIGYVTDPYWTDEIPLVIRRNRIFDHIFISCAEDLPEWQRKVGTRVSYLPWGSDALDRGSDASDRPWDLLRIGRQPEEWDDDDYNVVLARTHGVSYHPRPVNWGADWSRNHAAVMNAGSHAKFVLAFSNIAHQSTHTHPVRPYITGRWTDALACGAVVAGIRPRTPSIDSLLWPEATLELRTTQVREGMSLLRDAVAQWSPALSRLNHMRALERLDWRWRLADIARVTDFKSNWLTSELERLRNRLAYLKLSSGSPLT